MSISNAQAASQAGATENRTAAEIAAGVTPTNFGYAPGDVRRYGAVGNGVADDTTAFQNAILVSANGTMTVPAAIGYKITSTLTLSSPVNIVFGKTTLTFSVSPGISITTGGAGSNLTGAPNKNTKFVTAATSAFDIVILNATSNVGIYGIWFFGNAVATDPVSPVDGVYIFQSHENRVAGCTFQNLNIGVRLLDNTAPAATNPARNWVESNLFVNAYAPNNGGYGVLNVRSTETHIVNNTCSPGPFDRHGIYISAGSNRCVVTGNEVKGSTLAPLTVNSGITAGDDIYRNVIADNVLSGPNSANALSHGISITGKFYDNVVANNIIQGAGANGIMMQGASATVLPSNNIIKGNRIIDSQNEAIAIYDADGTVLADNLISTPNVSNTVTSDVVVGLSVGTVVENTLISGNIIRANPGSATGRYSITLNTGTGVNNVVASNNILIGSNRNAVNDVTGANPVSGSIGGIQTLTDAATVRFDPRRGRVMKITLSQATLFDVDVNNYQGVQGMEITMILTQDGTGGRAVTWASNFTDVSWSDAGNTAGKKSQISFIYDGLNWRQIGAQVAYH